MSTYESLGKSLGLEDIRSADWSEVVKPFWPAVFFSALVPRNFFRMLRSGWTTILGAIATVSAVCVFGSPSDYICRMIMIKLYCKTRDQILSNRF